ncbi:MAG: hypothetical protein HAW66_06640, partial [Shewanella sp.]|nr:hypothetical protein [Shewanella sp.]
MELLKVGMVSVVGLQLIKSLFKRLFWLSLLMMYFFKSAEAGEIEFVIKDVKNSSGVLYVQLFKGQENYQKMKV